MPTRAPVRRDEAPSLALALIAASSAPLLLLDEGQTVVAASASFCRDFQLDPAKVAGRPLASLGAGEWNVRQLASLLRTAAAGYAEIEAYEMTLTRPGQDPRRLVVNARKLDYGDTDNIRLLLTVADVTAARLAKKLKDDLLREKSILLQEVQHRVANSLQIIASVLMQSARKVQSEETRVHLYDAHQRVMSVAALQQQLAASRMGDVGLRGYFTDLCNSLGASMIHDHDQLSLDVEVDDSEVGGDISVSLGLVVTELVINALKHAFPGHRKGKIVVGYHSEGAAWSLRVKDDGIGMPKDIEHAPPGLGSSIIEALAKQLQAGVHVADAKPGTSVSLIHV